MRKPLILAGCVLLAAVLGGVLNFVSGGAPAPPAYPNPNGYDTYVAAANAALHASSKDLELPLAELQPLVTTNAAALRLAREGLEQESRVRNPGSLQELQGRLQIIGAFKSLAYGFAIEGRAAELEGDLERAADSYLDLIRVSHAASRRGLLIDRLAGMACERVGITALCEIAPKLPNPNEVAAELEKISAAEEATEDTLATEHALQRQLVGWQRPILRLLNPNMLKGPELSFEKKAAETRAAREQLIKDFKTDRR